MIGLPASGIHSNGMTLARRALLDDGRLTLDARPDLLGGQSVADVLLEPTVIYVRAILALIASEIEVRGLAHITGGGLMNLRRIGNGVGYRVSQPLPSPPVFELIAAFGEIAAPEMWEVFNMGCGFVAMVPAEQAEAAVALLEGFHPGTAVIGEITGDADVIELPHMRIRAVAGSERLTQY
jgi:phosphoribosylformylglycinamidine cyclo-ligase